MMGSLATKDISGIVETQPRHTVSACVRKWNMVSPDLSCASDQWQGRCGAGQYACLCVNWLVTQHQRKQSKNGIRIPEAQSGSAQRVLTGVSHGKQADCGMNSLQLTVFSAQTVNIKPKSRHRRIKSTTHFDVKSFLTRAQDGTVRTSQSLFLNLN